MDQDTKLEEKISDYQKLAKENPKIDVNMLMMSALQNQKENLVSPKMKKWAYLISLSAPPFGILFALKFYYSDEDDAKHVANMCVILTVLSLVMIFLFGKMLLSGSGTSLDQIQKIKPSDVMQLGQ